MRFYYSHKTHTLITLECFKWTTYQTRIGQPAHPIGTGTFNGISYFDYIKITLGNIIGWKVIHIFCVPHRFYWTNESYTFVSVQLSYAQMKTDAQIKRMKTVLKRAAEKFLHHVNQARSIMEKLMISAKNWQGSAFTYVDCSGGPDSWTEIVVELKCSSLRSSSSILIFAYSRRFTV